MTTQEAEEQSLKPTLLTPYTTLCLPLDDSVFLHPAIGCCLHFRFQSDI